MKHFMGIAVLSAYRMAEEKARLIDQDIDSAVRRSGNFYGEVFSAEYHCERVLELMRKKQDLLRLIDMANRAIATLEPKLATVLTARITKRLSIQQLSEFLEVSRRSIFRYTSLAIERFVRAVTKEQDVYDWLIRYRERAPWFSHICKRAQAVCTQGEAMRADVSRVASNESGVLGKSCER